jgi:DNA mismatch repair ATPase MutS
MTMTTFQSILFNNNNQLAEKEAGETPHFFKDLNLDQIVNTITAAKREYNLEPYFYTPLNDVDAVRYRHEIMQDLESNILYGHITAFSTRMRSMREQLTQADKLHHKYQKESWFLDAVETYCDAVIDLAQALSQVELHSRGFAAFREYVTNYSSSPHFTLLESETQTLKKDLSTVRYCLHIKGNCVKVRNCECEIDYSTEVNKTFEKFRQRAGKDYEAKLSDFPDMNHVEGEVLNFVVKLYPSIFLRLDDYCLKNANYLDKKIGVFDREIQFYVAYLDYMVIFKRAGLKFCYPQISDISKEVHAYDGFDLALAYSLIREQAPIVCNDFYLEGKERIIVVSGPNQGGKTTFARTFGQLHYLASLGCLVPGRQAQLFLFDQLFTHFEKEEDIKNLRGKLQDDLVRINQILRQCTSNSIIIINEIFTSTTLRDADFLGKKIMQKIIGSDSLCVCVTFIDELASLSEKTVSMVSTIVPENPALRTFKIIRKPADGLSYAISIAEKYRLTYDSLKERIKA